jgi:prevent-host-death family protein
MVRIIEMHVGIAEAKAKLSELVAKAERGEEVVIERHGKPVARLVPELPARKPFDFAALRQLREKMPPNAVEAGETVRVMRDGSRY